jgi:hypothetical protein
VRGFNPLCLVRGQLDLWNLLVWWSWQTSEHTSIFWEAKVIGGKRAGCHRGSPYRGSPELGDRVISKTSGGHRGDGFIPGKALWFAVLWHPKMGRTSEKCGMGIESLTLWPWELPRWIHGSWTVRLYYVSCILSWALGPGRSQRQPQWVCPKEGNEGSCYQCALSEPGGLCLIISKNANHRQQSE